MKPSDQYVNGAFLLAIGAFSLVIVASSRPQASRQTRDDSRTLLEVKSRTASLEVEGLEVLPSKSNDDYVTVQLSLKNVSDKGITGYTVTWCGGSTGSDMLLADGAPPIFYPGETRLEACQLRRSVPEPVRLRRGCSGWQDGIGVSAVVFDDLSGEGDPFWVSELMNTRRGYKEQTSRILAIVGEIEKETAAQGTHMDNSGLRSVFARLKARVESLPAAPRNGLPGFVGGLVFAKQRFLSRLSEREEMARDHPEKVSTHEFWGSLKVPLTEMNKRFANIRETGRAEVQR